LTKKLKIRVGENSMENFSANLRFCTVEICRWKRPRL